VSLFELPITGGLEEGTEGADAANMHICKEAKGSLAPEENV
jgi:hypothetical protein